MEKQEQEEQSPPTSEWSPPCDLLDKLVAAHNEDEIDELKTTTTTNILAAMEQQESEWSPPRDVLDKLELFARIGGEDDGNSDEKDVVVEEQAEEEQEEEQDYDEDYEESDDDDDDSYDSYDYEYIQEDDDDDEEQGIQYEQGLDEQGQDDDDNNEQIETFSVLSVTGNNDPNVNDDDGRSVLSFSSTIRSASRRYHDNDDNDTVASRDAASIATSSNSTVFVVSTVPVTSSTLPSGSGRSVNSTRNRNNNSVVSNNSNNNIGDNDADEDWSRLSSIHNNKSSSSSASSSSFVSVTASISVSRRPNNILTSVTTTTTTNNDRDGIVDIGNGNDNDDDDDDMSVLTYRTTYGDDEDEYSSSKWIKTTTTTTTTKTNDYEDDDDDDVVSYDNMSCSVSSFPVRDRLVVHIHPCEGTKSSTASAAVLEQTDYHRTASIVATAEAAAASVATKSRPADPKNPRSFWNRTEQLTHKPLESNSIELWKSQTHEKIKNKNKNKSKNKTETNNKTTTNSVTTIERETPTTIINTNTNNKVEDPPVKKGLTGLVTTYTSEDVSGGGNGGDTLTGNDNTPYKNNTNNNTNDGGGVLCSIFDPPTDLMFAGNFAQAMRQAMKKNKLVLVSIQNYYEFPSHVVNRDIFSQDIIRELIGEEYIFFQDTHLSYEGRKYIRKYGVQQFPHIGIIHPRHKTLVWGKEGWTNERPWCEHEISQSIAEVCFDRFSKEQRAMDLPGLVDIQEGDEEEEDEEENDDDIVDLDSDDVIEDHNVVNIEEEVALQGILMGETLDVWDTQDMLDLQMALLSCSHDEPMERNNDDDSKENEEDNTSESDNSSAPSTTPAAPSLTSID